VSDTNTEIQGCREAQPGKPASNFSNDTNMNILGIEPHYGGSHQAFLDGWIARSRHQWTLLTLPAYHWKWRMRHAPVTLAEQLLAEHPDGRWDVLLASDMLDLPQFLGLAGPPVAGLPRVAYFHENQLTYPVREEKERDLHFALTNLTTAHAADAVWFNSAFHRDEFLTAARALLDRLPPGLPVDIVDRIETKAAVESPGIEPPSPRPPRMPGPLRILWAARWEFDKRPEDFFAALDILRERNVDFRVSVIGEQFRQVPSEFAQAKQRLADRIDRWGFQPTRAEYQTALAEADVVVSTAIHEFFGLSMVEAIAAGAYPLLPRRLAYPEILGPLGPAADQHFYNGTVEHLAQRLEQLATNPPHNHTARQAVERFFWDERAAAMDERLELLSAT
jgi:glycosyltransferase involved in cell wall biosynthesis